MNRRTFLAATSLVTIGVLNLARAAGPQWPIGCFNRAWSKWGIDEALDGIKAAGYPIVGLLTRSRTEPFTGADATPEYLEALKKKIAARGLKANMTAIRTLNRAPLDEGIKDLRKQVDNAKTLN